MTGSANELVVMNVLDNVELSDSISIEKVNSGGIIVELTSEKTLEDDEAGGNKVVLATGILYELDSLHESQTVSDSMLVSVDGI